MKRRRLSAVEILEAVPVHLGIPGAGPLAGRGVAGEDPPADRRVAAVRVEAHLRLEVVPHVAGGTRGAPPAFAEVGPAVLTQPHDVDLAALVPVLPDLERHGHALARVQVRQCLAAQALEATSQIGVESRSDALAQ